MKLKDTIKIGIVGMLPMACAYLFLLTIGTNFAGDTKFTIAISSMILTWIVMITLIMKKKFKPQY